MQSIVQIASDFTVITEKISHNLSWKNRGPN